MHFQRFGDRTEIRFESGDEFIGSLTAFAQAESVTFAVFSGLGGVRSARIAYFNSETREYETHELNEQFEVISLIGNVALRDGKPFVHAHASLGRKDLSVMGGHVMELVARPTIELWLRREAVAVSRVPDDESGLALLDLPERL
jgi:predicted DNA-binding protein with PD1-like motif